MSIRDMPGKDIVFPLGSSPGIRTYYLRAWIPGRAQFPLSVLSSDLFLKNETNQNLLYGAYGGAMLAMAFLGVFFLLLFRERSYLYYVLYVLGYLAFQLGMAGYLVPLFPENPGWSDFIILVAAGPLAITSMLLFTRSFLKTSEHAPGHDRLLKVTAGLNAGLIAIWPIAPLLFLKKLILVSFAAGTLFSLSAALVLYRENYYLARYFLYSRILLYAGHIGFILGNLNLVPLGFFYGKTMLPASIADVTLLAFALADRIKLMGARISRLAADLQKEVRERAEANMSLRAEMDERARLEKEIVRVSDNERRRFSHELHDGLCQKLTGARLYFSALEDSLPGGEGAVAELGPLGRLLDESVNDAYDLSKGLWPLEHDPQGARPSLSDLCRRLSERNGIAIEFSQDGPEYFCESMPLNQLYRIGQEAITNAVKHAKASSITVSLTFSQADGIVLTVQDNGRGIRENSGSPGGLGIAIMSHRARMMGGRLEIANAKDGGAIVRCQVPPGAHTKEIEGAHGPE